MSLQQQFQRQLQSSITRTHQLLSTNFTAISQTRQLNQNQNNLLLELDANSVQYRQLAGALAIQTYINSIITLVSDCEPILELTAIVFQNLAQAKDELQQFQNAQISQSIDQAWRNLGKLAQITHQLFPNSPLISVHQGFIDGQAMNPSETIYGRLYEQNKQLKSKLQQNDGQVLQLQLKLTKLLQQHDGCEGNVDSSVRMLELRQQIADLQEEIQKMNEQFSYEIQKYNTVYQAMKRQIEELRSYSDINVLQMIEQLQTEIVKLREEKERDEIIINQLKDRIPVFNPNNSHSKLNSYSRVSY